MEADRGGGGLGPMKVAGTRVLGHGAGATNASLWRHGTWWTEICLNNINRHLRYDCQILASSSGSLSNLPGIGGLLAEIVNNAGLEES
jgi:hypothetical protein